MDRTQTANGSSRTRPWLIDAWLGSVYLVSQNRFPSDL